MIIQTAPENAPHFVILQSDHARASGQLAEAFGNADFASPTPRDLMIFVTAHHDEGWAPIDQKFEQSPATGLPHHLTQTPLPYLLETSAGSPKFNEEHHPFCGILSSMHTYGLFNGRYGLSDFIFIDKVPDESKIGMLKMLDAELARQKRLKAGLAAHPDTAAWVTEEALFNNYKLLQFFDTLALYFQMTHESERGESEFLHVPDGKGQDHTLQIKPLGEKKYQLAPWPFTTLELTLITQGRYLMPEPAGTDLRPVVREATMIAQTATLVAG